MNARTIHNGNGVNHMMVIPHLWSIVLAGGNGTRLAPLIKQWLGQEVPKQYCTFTGTRSLFQHTVDRADRLSPSTRRVTVVAAQHGEMVRRQLAGRTGRIVQQPANRDTAAGVFLPLTYVRAADPKGTVVIYPSDHFVYPEEAFLDAVRQAIEAVELNQDRVVLLGIRPEYRELDYGHLRVSRQLTVSGGHRLWTVGHFMEKPSLHTIQTLSESDLLWNTMVIVAKVDTLWGMAKQVMPSLVRLFEIFQPTIGTVKEVRVLESIYGSMPVRNFSFDLLERVSDRILALEVAGMAWSDCGRPERIVESLDQLGRAPHFPPELVGVA